jgi:hypothetical protein
MPESTDPVPPLPSPRRIYHPPRLKRIGTLKALTGDDPKSRSSVSDHIPFFFTKFFPGGPA